MIYTVEQAKEITCCGPENCGIESESGTRHCEGNSCGAWRWVYEDVDRAPLDARPRRQKSSNGYCGLAGKPDQ